jgi:hypothetical protein
VLAFILVAGIAAATYYIATKGAPAVDVSRYTTAAAEMQPASELKFLPDSLNAAAGMKPVAETDALTLYYAEETTAIAVLDKRSGKVWRSNPEDLDSDPIASPYEKEALASQLTVNYRDDIGTLGTFTNYAMSVMNGQFTTESIENGIRITYVLGDAELGIDALPKRISKVRYEERILSKVDDQAKSTLRRAYAPLKDNPEVLERLDSYVERPLVLARVLAVFEQAGYTEEDLAYDNEENGIGGALTEKPSFTVVVEYRLDGDTLVVRVPGSKIEEAEGFKIRNIELLEFFGAAGTEEQGYMFVPDGSGGLIHLNNGKKTAEVYSQRIYGDDMNDNAWRRKQIAESARLPVFGLKSGDHAWFAEVELGDAIASITADISGRQNSYNNIFASFMIRGEDWLELYKGARGVEEIQLLTEARYTGDLQIRFSFLSGSDATYSGMAKLYRERLRAAGKLKPLEAKGDLPFYVDALGAIDKRKSFLGVPYKGITAMTTVEEAGEIADALESRGIRNVRMRYLGWFNGGLSHTLPSKVDMVNKLGSKKSLRQLAERLESMGGGLYPDVALQHVLRDNFTFRPAADAARFVTREQAWRHPYDRALNRMNPLLGDYWLLSPSKLPHFVDRFMKGYSKYGIGAVSLRDLGDLVHADYRVNRVVFRENAKNIAAEQLAKLSGRYDDVLITGGNAYALPYADHIVNVPMETSFFNIVDETVPFYQMVIHGSVDYAGSPINLHDEQDTRHHLLRLAEYGAAPHFLWSHEPSSELKFTRYDFMFSTKYTDWIDEAADLYARLNGALASLRTQTIEEHIRHREGVVEVRYSDGTSIFVNYTDEPVTVDGVRIEAQNFAVGGDSR